jgi:hypothetical protein
MNATTQTIRVNESTGQRLWNGLILFAFAISLLMSVAARAEEAADADVDVEAKADLVEKHYVGVSAMVSLPTGAGGLAEVFLGRYVTIGGGAGYTPYYRSYFGQIRIHMAGGRWKPFLGLGYAYWDQVDFRKALNEIPTGYVDDILDTVGKYSDALPKSSVRQELENQIEDLGFNLDNDYYHVPYASLGLRYIHRVGFQVSAELQGMALIGEKGQPVYAPSVGLSMGWFF